MYWAQVSTTYSFSPQRNGQSSMFSGKSGFRIRMPGTTTPAMNVKSARLVPYATGFDRVPTPGHERHVRRRVRAEEEGQAAEHVSRSMRSGYALWRM